MMHPYQLHTHRETMMTWTDLPEKTRLQFLGDNEVQRDGDEIILINAAGVEIKRITPPDALRAQLIESHAKTVAAMPASLRK